MIAAEGAAKAAGFPPALEKEGFCVELKIGFGHALSGVPESDPHRKVEDNPFAIG
jgi:hypothetical protein